MSGRTGFPSEVDGNSAASERRSETRLALLCAEEASATTTPRCPSLRWPSLRWPSPCRRADRDGLRRIAACLTGLTPTVPITGDSGGTGDGVAARAGDVGGSSSAADSGFACPTFDLGR